MSNHRFDQIENMLEQLIKMQATNNTCIEEIRQDIKEIKKRNPDMNLFSKC